jgi:hypothetical protein
MGGLTVAVADLLLVVGSAVENGSSIDYPNALLGMFELWLLGMIVVGPFASLIAMPCAVVWATVTRHALRRDVGARTVGATGGIS